MGRRKLTSVPVSAAGFHFLFCIVSAFMECESLLVKLHFWLENASYNAGRVHEVRSMHIVFIWMLGLIVYKQRKREDLKK